MITNLLRSTILIVIPFVAGCGGSSVAMLKGRLVDNGQPFALPPGAGNVGIVFELLDAEGNPVGLKMYIALVNHDGTFAVVASGGELPVGEYRVGIDGNSAKVPQFGLFLLPVTKAKITLKPGSNDVNFDLAKPNGER